MAAVEEEQDLQILHGKVCLVDLVAAEQPILLVLPLLMVAQEMFLTQAQPLLEHKVSTVDLEVKDLDNLLLAAAVAELAQLAKINPQDQQLVVSEELEKLQPLVEAV